MDFEPLSADFLRITAGIVYCTVVTVDPEGRPRSRVMHPIFEVVDGRPRGWAVTDRTPVTEPPGWGDLSGYGEAGISHPRFHVLRLTPYRIQILRGEQFAAGDFSPRTWRHTDDGPMPTQPAVSPVR